jgi:hypothetical protein
MEKLRQGSQRMPVGKEYTEHSIHVNKYEWAVMRHAQVTFLTGK